MKRALDIRVPYSAIKKGEDVAVLENALFEMELSMSLNERCWMGLKIAMIIVLSYKRQ